MAWNPLASFFQVLAQMVGADGINIVSSGNPLPTSNGAGTSIIGGVVPAPSANSAFGTPALAHHLIAAASTNATSVKGATAILVGGQVTNTTTAELFLKIFNKASAPVLGTDTPVLTLVLPAAAVAGQANPVALGDIVGAFGYRLTAGLAYAITANVADLDATAVAAGSVINNMIYV